MPYSHYYTTLAQRLRAFLNVFLDFLAPPRRFEEAVRALTLEDLRDAAVSGESALPYHAREVVALVWELKYRKNPRAAALAGAYLAEELLAIASEELGQSLLIPVPMHPARRKERGYNQTELLCESALPYMEAVFEYTPDVLVRARATAPQQGLPKHERLNNVKNSMAVKTPARLSGRICVVVDDVTTTGATFKECKRALKAAGARRVHCVALARS
jgi:ComF family protein